MFVNHLLPAIALQNQNKAVKAAHHAAHLKPVCQKNRDRLSLLAKRPQHSVLQIQVVAHNKILLFYIFWILFYTVFLQIFCRFL